MRYLGFLLICLAAVLLAACPKGEEPATGDTSGKPAAAQEKPAADVPHGFEFDDDHLLTSLADDRADIRNFALLSIVNFDLKGYREPVLELAAEDPVAAVTAAAVYGETGPTVAYFQGGPEADRLDAVLGTVFGLECARQLPPELWTGLLDNCTDTNLDKLLWGMAQLDVEPGGPLQRSNDLTAALAALPEHPDEPVATYRRGAVDALLGTGDDRTIDWQRYVDYLKESPWNGTQWQALLRWAGTETWNDIVLTKDVDDRIRYQLARAIALVGPADVELPGGIGPWAGIDANIEYRLNQYFAGRTQSVEMPELDVLADQAGKLVEAGQTVTESDLTPRVLADVMALLDYAVVHHLQENVDRIVGTMEVLPSRTRAGILATIMRRDPKVLTDDLIEPLIELQDHEVAYFLLTGWFDREPVRAGNVARMVRNHPGSGNLVAVYAYQRWLEENGYLD